jgi:Flp pilus assembly protein TadD
LPEPDGSHLRLAIGGYERLVVLCPDTLDFRLALTRLYGTSWPGSVTPEDSQAIASADELIARFGDRPDAKEAVAEALRVKSEALERKGRLDDAAQALRALAQIAPEIHRALPQDAQTAMVLARHFERQGDDAQAATLYRLALQFDPSQEVAMNNLAMLLARTHAGLAEAESLARTAVAAQPRTAAFHDTLAQVLRAEKNFGAAQEAIGHAVALEPGNPAWRLSEAEVLVDAGQIEFARDLLDALPAPLPQELRARYDTVRLETGAPAAPQLHAGPPDD